MHRILSASILSILISLACPVAANAQAYPSKPINLVVTVPAGGSIDAVARLIASDLGPALGQPVLVVNKPGAGGNIAADMVARSAPDGHTLVIGSSSTWVVNPHVYTRMPFDPVKSFAPIAGTSRQNFILVVHPKLKVSGVEDLVAILKAQPGKLNYGSPGAGTLPQLACVLFEMQTQTEATHIPYTGIAPSLTALLAGHIDFMCDSASTIPHVRAGKVRALAVVGPNRLKALPEVQTFRELGLPGMEAAQGWYGIFAPAGTPTDVVQRLSAEIVRIMSKPAVVEKVSAMGLEPSPFGAEDVARALKEDLKRYEPIVKRAGVKAQ